MSIRNAGLVALVAISMAPGIAAAAEGEWLIAPYLWAADVSWDIAERGGGSAEFGDLVDKLDSAALIRVEYVRNKIGVTFDYVGMSLSDGTNITTPGPIPISIDIDASMDLAVLEAGVFYRLAASGSGFDILGGVRSTDLDATLIVMPSNAPMQRIDAGKSFTDAYVGARYLHQLNESWDLSVRGDYGFGGSNGALNLMAGLGWRSKGTFGMSLAYRHFEFDFDHSPDGEAVTSEFSLSGPALGFMFRF